MALETRGTVQMKGDVGPGVGVTVLLDESRLRLVSGGELIGEWELSELGVHALNDGFAVRAEGEEFVLKTEDDPALAEELGLQASTPRMARKVAASHPPEEREPEEEAAEPESNVPAIVFALAGVLVLAGGFLINAESSPQANLASSETGETGGGQFWLAFVLGGALMAGVAYILALGSRIARVLALVVLLAVVVFFALAAREAVLDANHLLAYGFIAGGIVVGVAVIFSGSLRGEDDDPG